MPAELDVIVVGAGVIGLAVARALARAGREVVVLEQEQRPGGGASSRSSEVIHAGIYYPPGSAKARHCVAGRELLYRYLAQHAIGHRRCGKLIVATNPAQLPRLEALRRNAAACGVRDLVRLDGAQIEALEPAVRGIAALASPLSGILDSHALMVQLQADLEAAGGTVLTRQPVAALVHRGAPGVRIEGAGEHACRALVNAAGLGAVALAASPELELPGAALPRQFYAKGHYFRLAGPAPFRRLIYPLPEPGGLGIHATPDLSGRVRFGPDVQWIQRVDYRFEADPAVFAAAISGYFPGLDPGRLMPDYTGVRTKLSGPDEEPADFLIQGPKHHGIEGLINLFGFESPGLTAALSVAEEVTESISGSRGRGSTRTRPRR